MMPTRQTETVKTDIWLSWVEPKTLVASESEK